MTFYQAFNEHDNETSKKKFLLNLVKKWFLAKNGGAVIIVSCHFEKLIITKKNAILNYQYGI